MILTSFLKKSCIFINNWLKLTVRRRGARQSKWGIYIYVISYQIKFFGIVVNLKVISVTKKSVNVQLSSSSTAFSSQGKLCIDVLPATRFSYSIQNFKHFPQYSWNVLGVILLELLQSGQTHKLLVTDVYLLDCFMTHHGLSLLSLFYYVLHFFFIHRRFSIWI